MVQFVKPKLLGTYNEYMNRFVNPITNGQYTDSTPYDIQLMRKRAHVLHKLLDGCVQRRDYAVLAPFLPPKLEFVVSIRLTPLQCTLYKVVVRMCYEIALASCNNILLSFLNSIIWRRKPASKTMRKANGLRFCSPISRICSESGRIRAFFVTTAIAMSTCSRRR